MITTQSIIPYIAGINIEIIQELVRYDDLESAYRELSCAFNSGWFCIALGLKDEVLKYHHKNRVPWEVVKAQVEDILQTPPRNKCVSA